MVGSKNSGNKRPLNNIVINATSEVLDYLRSKHVDNPKGLPNFQLVAIGWLNDNKEGFIKMHGKQVYDEHMKKFNRNATEMKRDKLKREKKRLAKRKKQDALKEKDLALREKELDIREGNSEIRKKKIDRADLEELEEDFRRLLYDATNPRISRRREEREKDLAKAKEYLEKIREIDSNRAEELTILFDKRVKACA